MFNFKNAREILSKILNIHLNYLSYILYVKKIENLYTTFKIPKKMVDIEKLMPLKMNLK